MDKGVPSSLFVNDGSFMERFKQLQQGQEKRTSVEEPRATRLVVSGSSVPKSVTSKTSLSKKPNDAQKTPVAAPGGKLAFSLKQKSKIVAPTVKLDEDEDEDERNAGNSIDDGFVKRQKLDHPDSSARLFVQDDVALSPCDPTVKKVADKLASFVAKNGRQFEHITRQKNPGDTPFKFLFDESCPEYKYYEHQLHKEEKALVCFRESQASQDGNVNASLSSGSRKIFHQQLNYQTPASALYEAGDSSSVQASSGKSVSSAPPSGADPISMMDYYMKKAAQEERKRPPKQSPDEMPPPPSLQAPTKRGHHMGDYIPLEELDKFMAGCNDVAAQKAAREAAEKSKIQANNVGHKLLSKMGWKEGEGLGSSRKGIADPIMAGNVKSGNLGVGAQNPGEVTAEDDIYEQYKKRMMLGYRHRPNPLGNPRKAYY